MTSHPSSSATQTELEGPVRDRACRSHGVDPTSVAPSRLAVGDAYVQLDGHGTDPQQLALEVFVTLGAPKPGQQKKLRADLLKLALVGRVYPDARLAVITTSAESAAWLRAGWNAEVLREFGIEVWEVALTAEERGRLERTREAQRVGNR